MKILPLVIYPDPLLHQVSKPVEKIDDALRSFMRDMVQTMYAKSGVGLAAVQVGELKRVLVMDVDYTVDDHDHHHHDHGSCGGVHVSNQNPRYFINPEIIQSSRDVLPYNEGCLSFPGVRTDVDRPAKVKVKYLDYNGKEQIEEMTGLMAVCIQHEIDHLNGVTFVDHVSKLKREMVLKKLKKISKNA